MELCGYDYISNLRLACVCSSARPRLCRRPRFPRQSRWRRSSTSRRLMALTVWLLADPTAWINVLET